MAIKNPNKDFNKNLLLTLIGSIVAIFLILIMMVIIIYPKLPSMDDLRNYQPKLPLEIYSKDGVMLGQFGVEKRIFIKYEQIPKILAEAIIAAEDERFYNHIGIDFIGIARAVFNNILSLRVQSGASTITMQVARNFFLSSKKTFLRKFNEALLAYKMEKSLTKNQILELYVNQIFLGQRSYGFAEATYTYFNKSIDKISIAECAMLAGLPKAPSSYNPIANMKRARERELYVLNRMRTNKFISEQEYHDAIKENIIISRSGSAESLDLNGYLTEMIRQMLYEKFKDSIYVAGYKVYTTIDSKLQIYASTAIKDGLSNYRNTHKKGDDVEGAIISLDPQTGAILALVGGSDYNKNKFNHILALRQPGSSFKPFLYSAALEKGYFPNKIFDDSPVCFPDNGREWCPKNDTNDFLGQITLREALARSRNVVAVKLLDAITPNYFIDYLQKFGFNKDSFHPYLTLSLGVTEATPLQMATAFATFANGGYLITPYLIDSITDYSGKVLAKTVSPNIHDTTPAIDPRNAFIINTILQDAVIYGTGARAYRELKRNDIAGKTGTTSDAKDVWFDGYTPKILAVVWVGFDKPKSLGFKAYGSNIALPIWVDYMKHALESQPELALTIPTGVSINKNSNWKGNDEYEYKGGFWSKSYENPSSNYAVLESESNQVGVESNTQVKQEESSIVSNKVESKV